jgi:serine phosphatase RsbU (regulator of sigma subunit)
MVAGEASVGAAPDRRYRLSLGVLVVGMLVFAGVALACWSFARRAEDQLLRERADEAAGALNLTVSQLRAPLDTAATLARVTGGDPQYFGPALEGSVGGNGQFSSAALFEIESEQPIATVGEDSVLRDSGSPSLATLLERTLESPFVVLDLLDEGRRFGYAVVDDPENPAYVVYAERTLSPDPYVRQRNDDAFARLDYAIYLDRPTSDQLVSASVRDLPLDGRTATATSPFGDHRLVLVMSPMEPLNGWFFSNLWWMVAAVGSLLSLAAAQLTARLRARRVVAETLAADNARLYGEQRHIAETLQLSLLPQHLDVPGDASVAARYWPAGEASLIGGDFYDVFRVDDQRWAVVIGDVCGKGIEAAAITGLVRHTARASARTSVSPSTVLLDIHDALSVHQPSTFCTVCFLYVTQTDGDRQQVTVSLGGHPRPLLRRADATVTEIGETGTLLGLLQPSVFDVSLAVEPGDTLVLYTDGLTDAPHGQAVPIEEVIDLLATEGDRPVEELIDQIRPLKRRRRPHGSTDDTAILVVRFGGVPATRPADTVIDAVLG